MKKTVTKEVTCCDCCEKEEHMETCINCKVEHCYACSKTEGKKYNHAVNFGGSSDGYYCKECDIELMSARNNARHIAYRKIDSLRNEAKAWSDDFRARGEFAMIEYGYKWFNGLVLCNAHIDLYNAITKRIEASHKEFLIAARHKMLIECFDVARSSV